MPTSIVLSEAGHEVVGVDIQDRIVESINNGISHISEKGLQEKLKKVINNKTFIAKEVPNFCGCFFDNCTNSI